MGRAPRKATWLRLETDPAFHFDFFLAEQLGVPLDVVRRMPMTDWMDWGVYYGRRAQREELAQRRGAGR